MKESAMAVDFSMRPYAQNVPVPATRGVLLLSPSGGGKRAVVNRITELRLAPVQLCPRDTTRPTQPWDNGTHRSLPHEEFHARMRNGEYLATMTDGSGNLYGIRKADVTSCILNGDIPVLRGLTCHAQDLGKTLAEQEHPIDLISVFLTTDPEDAWKHVVTDRGLDAEGRIATSRRDLRLLGTHHHTVDHVIVNRWGHLDETARAIAALLCNGR